MPLASISLLLTLATSSAQAVGGAEKMLHQFDGVAHDHLGFHTAAAGDVNADGFGDILVSVPYADYGGLENAGSIIVFSGADGTVLMQLDGPSRGFELGFFGVNSAGDVNADGFGDIILGAPTASPGGVQEAGSVFVFSGATQDILLQVDGFAPYDSFGGKVDGAGDVNGDGFDDLIVSAGGADFGGIGQSGSVFVLSGLDGSVLLQMNGGVPNERFGLVSAAGDVNGDGYADVIVGSPEAGNGLNSNGAVMSTLA